MLQLQQNAVIGEALRQEAAGKHAVKGCIKVLSREEL
jgi:hypothetical protein